MGISAGVIAQDLKAIGREIANYRAMTGEERLSLALTMHEIDCDRARNEIRQIYPEAEASEVERFLRHRILLAKRSR
jgi:hypothetical protein